MAEKKYTSIQHENAAGRVEFKGGKAVWQWAQDQNDSTSILIKSLDNPELELEKTQKAPVARAGGRAQTDAAPDKRRSGSPPPGRASAGAERDEDTMWEIRGGRGAGFDPYNRS